MTRGHYIAQTYLKQFAGCDGLLHAYRKSDRSSFHCRPKDVCFEWNGDIIDDFLSDPTLLKEYRNIFEPVWNPVLKELRAGRVSPAGKMAAAGYWANLLVCTPASRRIGVKAYDHSTLHFLRASDALNNEHNTPDTKLKEIVTGFESGGYRLDTKPDFVRAVNAKNLMKYTWVLYNANWIIIQNDTDIDFLTSDNPVAFNDPGPWRGGSPSLPRYLPVMPDLCLRCDMNLTARSESEPDFSLIPLGTVRTATIRPSGVRSINRAIVQCAEDLVISKKKLPSVETLIDKYANYKVDIDFIEFQQSGGYILGMHTRVCERSKDKPI